MPFLQTSVVSSRMNKNKHVYFDDDENYNNQGYYGNKTQNRETTELDVHDGVDFNEEKDHQLAVLNSLIKHHNNESTKNELKSKAFIRFDPTIKEHVKFEKSTHKKVSQKDRVEDVEFSSLLPEVSLERYYQTTTLDIGKGTTFSLRSLFQQSSDEVEELAESGPPEPMCVTQQEMGEQEGYWKSAGMWHESLFFINGDPRFKEATNFIYKSTKYELHSDQNKWSEHREKLTHFYRNKIRHHALWSAENQPQRKRQLFNAVEEFSYHSQGRQDQIDRQKKKKPHRKFFR